VRKEPREGGPKSEEPSIRRTAVANPPGEGSDDFGGFQVGVRSAETNRHWVRAAPAPGNPKAVAAVGDSTELRRSKTEVRELRRANGILKTAAGSSRATCRVGAVTPYDLPFAADPSHCSSS
jgi:hypothetical protein